MHEWPERELSWVYLAKIGNFKHEKETIAIAKAPGHRKKRKVIVSVYVWEGSMFDPAKTPATFTLKNDVPQGFVIARTVFNIHLNDMPETKSLNFGYADDCTLLYQSKERRTRNRSRPVWRSINAQQLLQAMVPRLNTTKSTTSLFHLDNHRANQVLKVNIDNKLSHMTLTPSTLVSHWTVPNL